MQFHRQLNRHVPSLGMLGDCFRTCIACFMNLHPSDVPHFMEKYYDGSGLEDPRCRVEYQAWLAERGLTLVDFVYAHDGPIQELLDYIQKMNGEDFTYMLNGMSITSPHVAIYRGNKLLWCPAEAGGIVGSFNGHYWVQILASLRCRYNDGE